MDINKLIKSLNNKGIELEDIKVNSFNILEIRTWMRKNKRLFNNFFIDYAENEINQVYDITDTGSLMCLKIHKNAILEEFDILYKILEDYKKYDR